MYRVKYISEDALPVDHDWIMVEDHGRFIFCIKRSAVCARVVAEGWAAYRLLVRSLAA